MSFKELVLWYYKTNFDEVTDEWEAIRVMLNMQLQKTRYSMFDASIFQSTSLKRIIQGIETAKTGVVFGWEYTKLNQVAHLLSQCDLRMMVTFLTLLKEFGHYKTLLSQDTTGRWKTREAYLRGNWHLMDTSPISTVVERNIARHLYPELENFI